MSDIYSKAIKSAKQKLKNERKAYKLEVKKQRLLRKQASIKASLSQMGVVNRQIPVVVHEHTQKIKVRIGV